MAFELPKLNYSYDSLEPHIDSKTMEIHHSKHHQTYVTKLNSGLEKYPELLNSDILDLVSQTFSLPEDIKNIVKNHGGGHLNHSIFWEIISPNPSPISDEIKNFLTQSFGSYEDFINKFNEQALSLFGSGWTWLVRNKNGNLEIKNYPNQENPIMYGEEPILGIDLWEHAYYLKNQNRRNEYIDSWWKVLDWDKVKHLFLND